MNMRNPSSCLFATAALYVRLPYARSPPFNMLLTGERIQRVGPSS
jgi:hypothetical protein